MTPSYSVIRRMGAVEAREEKVGEEGASGAMLQSHGY